MNFVASYHFDFNYRDFLYNHERIKERIELWLISINDADKDFGVGAVDYSAIHVQSSWDPSAFEANRINLAHKKNDIEYLIKRYNAFFAHFKESLLKYEQGDAWILYKYFFGSFDNVNIDVDICTPSVIVNEDNTVSFDRKSEDVKDERLTMRQILDEVGGSMTTISAKINAYLDKEGNFNTQFKRPILGPDFSDYTWKRGDA